MRTCRPPIQAPAEGATRLQQGKERGRAHARAATKCTRDHRAPARPAISGRASSRQPRRPAACSTGRPRARVLRLVDHAVIAVTDIRAGVPIYSARGVPLAWPGEYLGHCGSYRRAQVLSGQARPAACTRRRWPGKRGKPRGDRLTASASSASPCKIDDLLQSVSEHRSDQLLCCVSLVDLTEAYSLSWLIPRVRDWPLSAGPADIHRLLTLQARSLRTMLKKADRLNCH